MDTLYLLLKFVHVAAIIVWVGGIFALTLLNAHAAGSGNAAAQFEMGPRRARSQPAPRRSRGS